MKTLILLILAIVSNYATAGEHTLNARSRASWSHVDNDIAQTKVPSSSSFQIDYLNLTFAGNLSPSVKYEIMTDFLESNPNSNTDTVNGTTQFIEEAFVTKKILSRNFCYIWKNAH